METVKQNRTSVAQAGVHKPNGAMNSAFDVPRAPRKPLTLIDPLAVPVRSNVPIPPPAERRGSPYKTLLSRMKPGDCVELTTMQANSLRACASKLSIKLEIRATAAGKSTVWRK